MNYIQVLINISFKQKRITQQKITPHLKKLDETSPHHSPYIAFQATIRVPSTPGPSTPGGPTPATPESTPRQPLSAVSAGRRRPSQPGAPRHGKTLGKNIGKEQSCPVYAICDWLLGWSFPFPVPVVGMVVCFFFFFDLDWIKLNFGFVPWSVFSKCFQSYKIWDMFGQHP